MLAVALFTWWYGKGWSAAARNIENMLVGISRMFSVPILIRTLFAPWKRIITYPGAGLDAKMRAFGDNIVSRVIGFLVRFIVLLTAMVVSGLTLVFGVISVVLWPLLPPGVVVLLIKGITG
jgi:hypothetical protein